MKMPKTYISFSGVCLRDWADDDLPRYAELINDPIAMRFIGDGSVRDLDKARIEITGFKQELSGRGWSRWAVSYGDSGEFLGYAGFCEKPDGIDFGIRFLHKYWGTAYPYVSACLAIEYGFNTIGFKEVYSMNDVRHSRAIKLASRVSRVTPTQVNTAQGLYNRYLLTHIDYIERDLCNANRIEMARFTDRIKRTSVNK